MEMNEGSQTMEMLKNFHVAASGSDDDDDDNDGDANDCGDQVEDDMIEEYDEDEEAGRDEPVTLDFVEKPRNSWSLLRQVFPSKAGRMLAWLDPVNLPSNRSRLCDICGEPLHFVMQVYAPTSDHESTFHRTLYLFMCSSMTCLLRDQHEQWKRRPEECEGLPMPAAAIQSIYSSEPPRHDGTDKPLGDGAILCNWCGTWKGDKACAGCRRVRYCSEKHQAVHWRSGHRVACRQMSVSSGSADDSLSRGLIQSSGVQSAASNNLWPEFEIINEDENEFDVDFTDKEGDIEGETDRSWLSFQERIAKAPEQVLRYCRNVQSKPLWPMSSSQPLQADIPNCSSCGGRRRLEFQVLPQLLYYFGVKNDADSLDWATIVVYACEARAMVQRAIWRNSRGCSCHPRLLLCLDIFAGDFLISSLKFDKQGSALSFPLVPTVYTIFKLARILIAKAFLWRDPSVLYDYLPLWRQCLLLNERMRPLGKMINKI